MSEPEAEILYTLAVPAPPLPVRSGPTRRQMSLYSGLSERIDNGLVEIVVRAAGGRQATVLTHDARLQHRTSASPAIRVLHLDTHSTGRYALCARKMGEVIVWSVNDSYSRSMFKNAQLALSQSDRRVAAFSFLRAARALVEELIWGRFVDCVLVVSEPEAAYFRRLGFRCVQVLPLAREAGAVPLAPQSTRAFGVLSGWRGSHGAALLKFVQGPWPEVWRRTGWPLRILTDEASPLPKSELTSLGIEVVPAVDNLVEFMRSVDVVVAPFPLDLGMSTKGVDALAYGRPVCGLLTLRSLEQFYGPSPAITVCESLVVLGHSLVSLAVDSAVLNAAEAAAADYCNRLATERQIADQLISSIVDVYRSSDRRRLRR